MQLVSQVEESDSDLDDHNVQSLNDVKLCKITDGNNLGVNGSDSVLSGSIWTKTWTQKW